MGALKDKLIEALNAKQNDVKTFVWKMKRDKEGGQQEIRLMDATPEQLNNFYQHCQSMLYSTDKINPGRYTLLNIINEQRRKCNVELLLRKLENGSISADGKPYPRYVYLQDLRSYIKKNNEKYPADELNKINISSCAANLPKEFESITIAEVINACLDQLGILDLKHLTFSFILKLGVYLTPDEMKDFNETDKNGKKKSKLEIIKERLNIKPSIRLTVKPTGLSFKELRAMTTLKQKKYSELTTDQLTVLRNKVLFKLEDEVQFHIRQWEERIRQIKLVAKERGIELVEK